MENTATATEVKKTYAESVQRINRFTISTLTILLILVVIVQQELLNANFQARKLRREVISSTERLDRYAKSLAEQSNALYSMVREPSWKEMFTTEFQIDEFPRLSGYAALTPDGLKQIEAMHTQLAKRLREEAAKPHKTKGDTQLIITLEDVTRVIKEYKRDYQNCLSLKESALTKRKQLQDMRAAKQSIPTPFGNFQVPPKLALMALAFAAVITYLSFNVSVMKLRALTRTYLALQEGTQTIPLDRSPPFWLYGRGSSNFPSLFTRQTGSAAAFIASVGLHAGWVIFAGWLVYESWTWKSSGTLLFRYKHLSDYLLVVLLAVAVVLALVQLVPRLSKESLSISRVKVAARRGFNRRAFLVISITGLITGAAYYFGFRRASQPSNKCAFEFDSTPLKSYEQDFVTNLRTRVLHHRLVCQKHLPRPQNRLRYEASLSSVCLHASSTSRILEQLAVRDASHHRYEPAVANLKQAIDRSPLSYHLYDRLIGLYGRLRQYDEIEKLLKIALLRVKNMKEQMTSLKKPASLRAQKRMQRAQKEFSLRYRTYNDRKQQASNR